MTYAMYLCEKPSQARALAKLLGADRREDGALLGNGVAVVPAHGHLLELEPPDAYIGKGPWSRQGLPVVPAEWKWRVKPNDQAHFDMVGRWLANASSVVIATDPDDEGEVVGRQLLAAHGFAGPVLRLWASALDPDAVRQALGNLLPLSATDSYYHAGLTRRRLDWLLGMNLTRAYSVQFGQTTHIGRVKTKVMAEIVDRSIEVKAHTPTSIQVLEVVIGNTVFEAGVETMASTGKGICISSVDEPVSVPQPLPYTLTSLLADASEFYGIGVATGYAAAQALYEAAAISYPRTGSTAMPSPGAAGFAAHHAIITTRDSCPAFLDEDAHRIFALVQQNGVMQALGAAQLMRRTTVFDFGGVLFTSVAKWLPAEDHAGWMLCDHLELSRIPAQEPASFKVGERVAARPTLREIPLPQPQPYTEATLLRLMGAYGIGTEATRAHSISSLYHDALAEKRGNWILPTSQALGLAERLPPEILSHKMETLVGAAVEAARRSESTDPYMERATQWLTRMIHGKAQEPAKVAA